MREREVEAYFQATMVARLGAEVRKLQWLDRRGAPDRIAMFDGFTLFVECKSTKGTLDPHQRREIIRMLKVGQTVLVVNDFETTNRIVHWFEQGRHLLGAPDLYAVTNFKEKTGIDPFNL